MRTLLLIVIGIAVLFFVIAVAAPLRNRRRGGPIDGAMVFAWLWLVFAIVDGYVGVSAGHGLVPEWAFHVVVFAVPAALAWYPSRGQRFSPPLRQE